jgi:hypothetical protein
MAVNSEHLSGLCTQPCTDLIHLIDLSPLSLADGLAQFGEHIQVVSEVAST